MRKILVYLLEKEDVPFEYNRHEERFALPFNIKNLIPKEGIMSQQFIWNEIVKVVKAADQTQERLIILSKSETVLKTVTDSLLEVITVAFDFNVKLLISNTSSEDVTLVPVWDNLFWTDSISGFEFLVIYESCFDLILNENFVGYNNISECLENLTSNKMLIYPMINVAPMGGNQEIHMRMKRLVQMRSYLQKNKLKLQNND